MSGEDVIRVTIEIDREKFYADLSEGGYDSFGRLAAWKLVRQASYDLHTEAGRDYGMRVVPTTSLDTGSGEDSRLLSDGSQPSMFLVLWLIALVLYAGLPLITGLFSP